MYRGEHGVSGWREPRGQSNVIAVVLLAGLVLTSATVVLYAGSTAVSESSASVSVSAAENALLSMDRQINQYSNGEISEASVAVDGSANDLTVATSSSTEAGIVTITAGGTTKSYVLGTVKYERDGQTVAYQGGGVWRKAGNGSTVVSPPPVSYRTAGGDETLSFPVVQVDGQAVGTDLTVDSVEQNSLLGSPPFSLDKQVSPGTVIEVEIQSEFYDAWAERLKEEVGGGPVTTKPDKQKVIVKFEAPSSAVGGPISSGAFSDGPTSTLENGVDTDSYTSTGYPGFHAGEDGDIRTMDEFSLKNSPMIHGDVHAKRGSEELTTSGAVVFGQVRLGCCVGPTTMTNGQTYHKTFSTKDDILMDGSSTFKGNVIVGGSSAHGNSYSLGVSGQSTFEEDVHVHGNLDITDSQEPTFEGDIYVKDGDVDLGKTKGEIDGSVYVKNGDFVADSDTKQVVIDGDLVVDGDVSLDNKMTVNGDVLAGGSYSENGATVHGTDPSSGSPAPSARMPSTGDPDAFLTPLEPKVPERGPVDSEINSRQTAYAADNDNAAASDIDDSTDLLTGSCGCTLTEGDYYLERLHLGNGDVLEMDTGGNTINVYVEEDIELTNGGSIEVHGGGRVNLWVGGSGSGPAFEMTNPSTVHTIGSSGAKTYRAPGVWTYLKKDSEATFQGGNTVYTGVIYGPGEQTMSGGRRVIDVPGTELTIPNSVNVYGAVVGHVVSIDNSARLHYDTNLGSDPVLPSSGSSSTAPVDFVTINRRTTTVED